MSSVANEISENTFDVEEITPEFNQNADPTIQQEDTGQAGIDESSQQSEKSDEGIQGTAEMFNSVAPEPTMDIYQQDLERYADVPEDSFENSHEQFQQLDSNELENNYDLENDYSL